jgi:hypothetical protein
MFKYAMNECGVGTYARNGCAAIAVYNAHQLLGEPKALGKINNDFLYKYGTFFLEYFGILPSQIGAYFRGEGYEVTGYFTYAALKSNLSDGDVIVCTVMNNTSNIRKGFHTMAAIYRNGVFIVYNVSSKRQRPFVMTDLVQGDQGWIFGYIVGV